MHRRPGRISLSRLAAAALLICHSVRATVFTVTTTVDGGAGSLRQAMLDANASSGNLIAFNFSGKPPFTISLTNALPAVTNAMTIDGRTQAGYAVGAPAVELNGAGAGSGAVGLQLNAGNSAVYALGINRFSGNGILLNGGTNVIRGNFIGTDPAGTLARGNGGYGLVANAGGSLIGGTNAGEANVISGNGQGGLYLNGAGANGNAVRGNFIGTDAAGTVALGNTGNGVSLFGAPGNFIGPGNVISANTLSGIALAGAAATNNTIIGNFIGTDATGNLALGNAYDGIYFTNCAGNQIGGFIGAGAGNVISGNLQNGVLLTGGANGNAVQGNLIGLAANGTNALKNYWDGVLISGGSANFIGASKTGDGNFISGNGTNGVFIGLATDAYNVIAGNYVGTDATGKRAAANAVDGVLVLGRTNTIGGNNVISGNGQIGVALAGGAGNVVSGDFIGTDATGATALPNAAGGIYAESVAGNFIGGATAGAGNVIAGNLSSCGILLTNATGFVIAGNYVGLNAAGSGYLRNWGGGVFVYNARTTNWIGGATAGARNVISGNNTFGVSLVGCAGQVVQGNYVGTDAGGKFAVGNTATGINLQNSTNVLVAGNVIAGNGGAGQPEILLNTSTGNALQGNYVGTDAAGTNALGPGAADGIYLLNSSGNSIGGSGAGNVVGAGNVGIYFLNASQNSVKGNSIGVAADGFTPLGDNNHNINLDNGSTNNVIGGVNAGEGNRIAYAQTVFSGVRVRTNAFNNTISGNSIFNNGGLGVDLGNVGVNANVHLQAGVAATNANRLQNYPVLTNALSVGGAGIWVRGYFDSAPNKTYALEFFTSPAGSASGYGEGRTFLLQTNLTLGAVSPTNFSFTLPGGVGVVTATATDPAGNTSEFSGWLPSAPVARVQSGVNLFLQVQFPQLWTNAAGSYTLVQSTNLNPPTWLPAGVAPTNLVFLMPFPLAAPVDFFRLRTP
jgi:titin